MHLFSNYKNELLPTADLPTPLKVDVEFYIASLHSINEVDETFSMMTGLVMYWTDPNLVWEPSSYGNISRLVTKAKDVWLPPLYLVNQMDLKQPYIETMGVLSTIQSDGRVEYGPGALINAKCPMDFSKFPYDSQSCTLQFVPWGYPSYAMLLSPLSGSVRLDYFTPQSDWKLIESNAFAVQESYEYSMFFIEVKIKRESLYFTIMIVLPTLLFSLLNPLVFVLPNASGERVSLSVTILLSYTIFLTLVSSSIPTSSNPMCVLLILMIVITGVSTMIVCGTVVTSKYFYLDNNQALGAHIKLLVRVFRKKNDVKPIGSKSKEELFLLEGKNISSILDTIFFYGSYVCITVIFIAYFIYVMS